MKSFVTLLSISAVVGALSPVFSKDYHPALLKRTGSIVDDLGPILSPGASIIFPTDDPAQFAELTKRYVEIFHPDITVIVQVGTEADVPRIIKYAKRKHRAILAGSRRHGWAVSLNDVHNAIMIDISTLSDITIDASGNTMTVGGGITVGEVMTTLQAAGKETSTGICDCVGLLGATLGGGHGRLQGLYGLMADNLILAHLATAAGDMIVVSPTSHPDLLWGLRGAGHNFGIVTKAVFKIYDQTNGGQQFNADITYAEDQLEALFTAINAFEQTPETSVVVVLVPIPGSTPLMAMGFTSSAPTADAVSQLNAAFGHIPYLTRTESVIPWDQMNTIGALGVGAAACGSADRKNAFGVSLIRYDIPAVRTAYELYADFVMGNPTATGTIMLFETYPAHGVQAVPEADTAYPHREERHIILLLAGYPDASLDDAAKDWLETAAGVLHATSGFAKPAVYMNYAQGTEGFGALYGYEWWRQARLKQLKRRYDPDATFSGYHPIPRY